jgi:DNA-binding PadR family transcriptional regulator
LIELAILGLLKESDLHGYELKKRLVEALGPFSSVSFGSLYPALARLQRAGAVETSEPPVPGPQSPGAEPSGAPVPMTGSIAGEAAAYRARRATSSARRTEPRSSRVRKVYRITEHGQALFEELLAADTTSADTTKAFNLKLAFCRYMRPEARLVLLERRRAQLVEQLARYRSSGRRRERMDTYTRSLMEHDTEATERDISWLDSLIASEKQRAAAPADPTGRRQVP